MSERPDDLQPVYDAALPKDAPGAWIRDAIELMRATFDHPQDGEGVTSPGAPS